MLDMDAGSASSANATSAPITTSGQYTRNTLFDEKIGGTCHFALGAGLSRKRQHQPIRLHWELNLRRWCTARWWVLEVVYGTKIVNLRTL